MYIMNIYDNNVFIFSLTDIIINNEELLEGYLDFLYNLEKYNKFIYILNNINQNVFNKLIENYPVFLKFNIILIDTITNESYLHIIKNCINKFELYEIISFNSNYDEWIIANNIIYNNIFINKNNSIHYKNIIKNNIIENFINIDNIILKKNIKYIPFYISSKTKHRNKWLELIKKYPIKSRWIYNDKDKIDLDSRDRTILCDIIKKDIKKCKFGIFYCEIHEIDHIGSLIEIGMLISHNKKIFLCGDNIYKHEVLFNFKNQINMCYIDNPDMDYVFKKIQYENNKMYILYKKKY